MSSGHIAVADSLWIVGPGRLGLALGWMLSEAGAVGSLRYIGRSPVAPAHPVFAGRDVTYSTWDAAPPAGPDLLILSVPDDTIPSVVVRLAAGEVRAASVLHTSGVLASDALSILEAFGTSTGSIHPLVSIPDPVASAGKLRGAWYGLEGAGGALRRGEALVAALDGHALPVNPGDKPAYHAAAVFASNFVVALLHVAVGLMERSGVDRRDATAALAALAAGAVSDVARTGAERSLTGPILRGDVRTIELHLARLSPEERSLYSGLARDALEIAKTRGLPGESARRLSSLLEAESS